MKTTDTAINRVFSLIKTSTITLPVYKLTKPSEIAAAEYIVINALPISTGVMQKCIVNVNYHVKNLKPGMPNLSKLETVTASLMTLLQENSAQRILIDFDSQEYFNEEDKEEHYSNIRLKVKIVNA